MCELRRRSTITIVPAGAVRAELNSVIPWMHTKDYDFVIQHDGETKMPISIADLACQATQFRGITSLLLPDHSMSPMVKAQCSK